MSTWPTPSPPGATEVIEALSFRERDKRRAVYGAQA